MCLLPGSRHIKQMKRSYGEQLWRNRSSHHYDLMAPPYHLQPPPVELKRPQVIYNMCGSWWSSHKKVNIHKQRLRHTCRHTRWHPNTHSLLQKRNQNFWEMWTQLSPQNTVAGILFLKKNSDFTSGNQLFSVSSPRKTATNGGVLMIVLRSFESIILWGIFSYMKALSVI